MSERGPIHRSQSLPKVPNACQRLVVLVALGPLALARLHCGRTGLYPYGVEDEARGGEGGIAGTAGAPRTPEPVTAGAGGEAPDVTGPSCEPFPEVCNGVDDDCDGRVDDVPPVACEGGGLRHCIAGQLSACPRRCETCVAGSVRICQNSYCTFWGEQECSADGQGFGPCREEQPPPECAGIARRHKDSPELEQCCIDAGYCCLDSHDLDRDGDRGELLGNCASVTCE